MRVLIAHSFYRQPGGEDRYVRQQVELLSGSHEVRLEERINAGLTEDAATAAGMLRSRAARTRLLETFRTFRPDVIHLHNPYPAMGPEVHFAARSAGLPLLQTAHNFRLRCPNGLLYTEGAPCDRCVGGRYDNAVRHECFPTAGQRIAYASALWVHRFVDRLDQMVDVYIAPSRYVRNRLIEWGIPADQTRIVRNFTQAPASPPPLGTRGMFLGRLSPEKGVDTLIEALALAGDPPFDIVGDGPERAQLMATADRLGLRRVRFHGLVPAFDVPPLLASAAFIVMPSRWPEPFGLSAIEAMGAGRPVIASDVGALSELAGDERGQLVAPQAPSELAAAITGYLDEPSRAAAHGEAGRRFVLDECSAEAHLANLEAAYRQAIEVRARLAGKVENDSKGQPPRRARRPVAGIPAPTTLGRRPLHVLMVHCYYRDLGGENLSFEAEAGLLEAAGVRVTTYTRDNRELDAAGPARQLMTGMRTTWSDDSYTQVRDLIRRDRPDVVHFQNTFPLISPSAIHAAHRMGVPVVQALRNYRLLCAKAVLYRDGAPCNDCVGKAIPLPAIQHSCYRGSLPRTGAVVSMQVAHRVLGTWRDAVTLFVTPSEYARDTFTASGTPADRIVVKPNFVDPDPGVSSTPGSYALFAGRLELEKGALPLVEAWRDPTLPKLLIAGDGPLRDRLQGMIAIHGLEDRVELLGHQSSEDVIRLMRDAQVVVFPSLVYETFGRVTAEAFACGVPVVASRLGAMAEVVEDGVSGRLFTAGDPIALAAAVLEVTGPGHAAMRVAARAAYEARYTADRNLEQLLAIYDRARDLARAGAAAS